MLEVVQDYSVSQIGIGASNFDQKLQFLALFEQVHETN